MANHIRKIGVIGDGGWGTTLAIYLQKKGFDTKLWGAFPEYVQHLIALRENTKFLPGIKIPENLEITDDLGRAVEETQLIVLAVPSQFAKSIIVRLKSFDLSKKVILSVVKGIENENLMRISQVIEKELKNIKLAVLSGPTIASEIAKGIPSTAVISSKNSNLTMTLQKVFNSSTFRIYTNPDLIGVELGGSIKNVIAIACGICDGLGLGTNAKAALLTRGLAEMARLGKAMGAKESTFAGLTGLGDLATTCFNTHSRNRSVGEELGKGKGISEVISAMSMVAEGVTTVKAVYRLSKKYKVAMPITTEVFNMVCKNKKAAQAVHDLMARKMKAE